MAKVCPKCGMKSERDDLCTWCNADLRAPQKPGAKAAPAPVAGRVSEPEAAQERPVWLVPAIVGGGIILALIVVLVAVWLSASAPPAAPGDWKTFVEKDKLFAAEYPSGWGQPSNSGSPGTYVLVVWRGGKLCAVTLSGTQVSGAMGDAAATRERVAGGNLPISQTADGSVLAHATEGFKSQRSGYKATEVKEAYDFANVRAACVEYTYTKRVGLVPIRMKGIRWGAFQMDFGYHVYAEAPEKHWETFKPIAERIVGSVQFGGGAGR